MAKHAPNNDARLLNEPTILKAVELANAGARIIQVRSHERERVRQLAQAIVDHPKSTRNFKYAHGWNASSAVLRLDNGKQLISHGEEGEDSLAKQLIGDVWRTSNVWVLEDFHHFFSPQIDFKETVQAIDFLRVTASGADDDILIILSGPASTIPNELLKDVLVMDLPLPDLPILAHIATECTGLSSSKIDEEILDSARGLTANEARRAFVKAWQSTGKLAGREAAKLISQEKAQAIRGSNSLEFFDVGDCNLGQVGGMENVKKWLQKRKIGLKPSARKIGLEAPKGMLLLGVQGCGKSLLAKAVSQEWNMPLLRFDIGKVMGMYIGESESNMRAALQVAEAVSPCVLWIDEIEKALAGAGGGEKDGGTTVRVFGTLLTWMQEKKETVFVVATANSVLNLPPELLRKGRFDEIFFVDLPDEATRSNIFDIHCRRRGHILKQEELKQLAAATDGFSGAEIESCVSEGLYNWAEEGIQGNSFGKFGTSHIQSAINVTRPLSVLMGESIHALRKWAADRARPAAGTAK